MLGRIGWRDVVNAGRRLTFSQREGYEDVPRPLQLEQLPLEARTMIWNVLYEELLGARYVSPLQRVEFVAGVWERILRDKHIFLDALPRDEWDNRFVDKCAELKGRIREDSFNRVFDLIQFIMTHPDCPHKFTTRVALVFRHFQLAYKIDTGPPATIVPAATVEEGEQLTRSLEELRASGLDGCLVHLRNASKCINDGDSVGGVRESIQAVESVARQIDPKESKTLGPALASLEKQSALHPALKEAFNKLYGYTSREQGIRHALLDNAKANVTIDEAVFMLGACASFASYLWRKHMAAKGT